MQGNWKQTVNVRCPVIKCTICYICIQDRSLSRSDYSNGKHQYLIHCDDVGLRHFGRVVSDDVIGSGAQDTARRPTRRRYNDPAIQSSSSSPSPWRPPATTGRRTGPTPPAAWKHLGTADFNKFHVPSAETRKLRQWQLAVFRLLSLRPAVIWRQNLRRLLSGPPSFPALLPRLVVIATAEHQATMATRKQSFLVVLFFSVGCLMYCVCEKSVISLCLCIRCLYCVHKFFFPSLMFLQRDKV